jgi:hypothetical protein
MSNDEVAAMTIFYSRAFVLPCLSECRWSLCEILLGQRFHVDQPVARALQRRDDLVELQVDRQRVLVLREQCPDDDDAQRAAEGAGAAGLAGDDLEKGFEAVAD